MIAIRKLKNSSSKDSSNSNNSESNKVSEETSDNSSADSNDANNSASLSTTEDNNTGSAYETATIPKDGKEFHLLKSDDKMVLGAHYIIVRAHDDNDKTNHALTVDASQKQYDEDDSTKFLGVGAKCTMLSGMEYNDDAADLLQA